MWDVAIINAHIVTSQECYAGNLYVRDGKIGAISREPLSEPARETIDAQGLDVFPGFIDTHVHSRDGGAPQKETFFHSTQAAAAGGLTTICEMPNAIPPVSNVANMKAQLANLSPKAHVDFAMWGLCVGELNNKDLADLAAAGVVAFKFFWGYAIRKDTYNLIYNYNPDDPCMLPPLDDGQVYELFEAVAKTGRMLGIHAENAPLMHRLASRIKVEDFPNEYEAMLASRPAVSEETIVQTAIAFSRATDMRLHVLHASADCTVDLVERAQQEGLPITMETCPHYLVLTSADFERVGNNLKGYPPIRSQQHQDRLWQGIADGVIAHVCSDHAPHTAAEKQGSLFAIPSGMCGVESLAPLMIDAVNRGKLSKRQLAAQLSENPARLYGLYPRKGAIQVGADADFTFVDFARPMTIREQDLHSVSKITAFDGFQLQGAPVRTVVRGRTVAIDGKIVSEPCGCFVPAWIETVED